MASSVALAFRKVTTATTPSTFFNKVLRLKPPFTAISPFTNRYFSSSTTTDKTSSGSIDPEASQKTGENPSGECDPPIVIKGSPQMFKMDNPFQFGGKKDAVAVDERRDSLLVRITLPGVGEGGCKVWVENNTVFFAGEGEIECEGENSGRSYRGSLKFNPEFNKVNEVKED